MVIRYFSFRGIREIDNKGLSYNRFGSMISNCSDEFTYLPLDDIKESFIKAKGFNLHVRDFTPKVFYLIGVNVLVIWGLFFKLYVDDRRR